MSRPSPNHDSLRVAVVGCGPIGNLHAQAVADSPHAKLVAVCDSNPQRRDATAARYRVEGHADLAHVLEKARPDVITVATPDHLHVEPALAALRAGCHVFCEKPLAESADEARQMVAAAAEHDVQLAVDYNRRFAFGYHRARHALDHGIIGRLRYALVRVADRVPPPSVARTPYAIFTTLLTHHLDLMRWYGGEIRSLQAVAGDESEGALVRSVTITMSFAGGAVGTIVAGYRDNLTRTVEWLELGGAKGSVVADDITRRVILTTGNPDCARILEPNPFAGGDAFYDSLTEHVQSFLAHLARNEPVPVSGHDGVAGLELAEAAIASLNAGRVIEVDVP